MELSFEAAMRPYARPRRIGGGGRNASVGAAIAVVISAAACAATVVFAPEATRLLVALLAAAILLALFEYRPSAGFIATIVFIALIALLRRMLIPAAGWTTHDPILLVAPLVVTIQALRLFAFGHSRVAGDRLSLLVAALFALVALQSLNPRNGSLAVGAGGLLFSGLPLLWFFVARDMLDRRTLARILQLVVALGVAIAAYGFYQATSGLPSWDAAWTQVAGYGSLYLQRDLTNTFGTFASTSEYTIFMGVAIAAAIGLGLHGKRQVLLSLPITGAAIFLSSNRSAFVFTLMAVVVMFTLKFVRPRMVPFALLVTVLLVAGASPLIGAALRSGAAATGNPRVEYQLSGLGDPLNREQSTLTLHWALVTGGIRSGVADPFGRGSGVTNASVMRFGGDEASANANTEVDVSNAFVSLGLFGGLIFLATLVTALWFAIRNYLASRDGPTLAIVGILIATFAQWLNGGHYAVTPLLWMLLGVTAAISAARSVSVAESAPAPAAD